MRYDEYFAKPPLLESMTIPSAIDVDENTLITVSEDVFVLLFTFLMARPNIIPNMIMLIITFFVPSITPIAMPVRAL